MKHLNVKPNIRTYELLFSLFSNINVPYEEGHVLSHVDVSKRISIIETDMLNNEIQHSFVSMKNLVCLLPIYYIYLPLVFVCSLEETKSVTCTILASLKITCSSMYNSQ